MISNILNIGSIMAWIISGLQNMGLVLNWEVTKGNVSFFAAIFLTGITLYCRYLEIRDRKRRDAKEEEKERKNKEQNNEKIN